MKPPPDSPFYTFLNLVMVAFATFVVALTFFDLVKGWLE